MLRSIGRWRALAPALVGLALVAGTFVVVPPPPVAAAANAWKAPIGTGGKNGTVTLQVVAGGTAKMAVELAAVMPSNLLPVTIAKGTCAKAGATLWKNLTVRSTVLGTAAAGTSLSKSFVAALRTATKGSGKVSVRIGTKATGIACGQFAPWTPPPSSGSFPVLVATQWYVFGLPDGWTLDPDGEAGYWVGPGARWVYLDLDGPSWLGDATLTNLDVAATLEVGMIEGAAGWAVVRTEGILVGDRPAILMTLEEVEEGISYIGYDALIGGGEGPVITLAFGDLAGTPAADRSLFLRILGTVRRLPSGTSAP